MCEGGLFLQVKDPRKELPSPTWYQSFSSCSPFRWVSIEEIQAYFLPTKDFPWFFDDKYDHANDQSVWVLGWCLILVVDFVIESEILCWWCDLSYVALNAINLLTLFITHDLEKKRIGRLAVVKPTIKETCEFDLEKFKFGQHNVGWKIQNLHVFYLISNGILSGTFLLFLDSPLEAGYCWLEVWFVVWRWQNLSMVLWNPLPHHVFPFLCCWCIHLLRFSNLQGGVV